MSSIMAMSSIIILNYLEGQGGEVCMQYLSIKSMATRARLNSRIMGTRFVFEMFGLSRLRIRIIF